MRPYAEYYTKAICRILYKSLDSSVKIFRLKESDKNKKKSKRLQ